MADSIRITYNGTPYILEFDRDSVTRAERSYGISLNDLSDFKLTTFQSLFRAALIKHHPNMKPNVANGLFEKVTDKSGLYMKLVEMYAECANSLLEDPEDEGNALGWEVV